ncbi:MAG: transglycosylase SLT domain-containing protein [Synergistaceae bacterium]|nr:transglycosylase SLT domain-containing protein [Synergistaceae bacterium]
MCKNFKIKLSLIIILILSLSSQAWAANANASMYDLFWRRAWPQMESLYNSQRNTPQDHALMANAYRFQNKWAETVRVLEAHGKSFPASVRPYADMTLILGYEKLKRYQEALSLAENLYKTAPQDLKYYIALAQYRILKDALKSQDVKRLESALNKMLNAAGSNDRKIYALTRLVSLPGNRTEQALSLLNLQPSNKEAAGYLAKLKSPNNNIKIALGIYYHLAGNAKSAFDMLQNIPLKSQGGRKAAYYRAWSLSRQKRNQEALNLWGSLALNGNAWAESSVRRIAALAKDKGMREPCINALDRISRERKGDVQARALLSLSSLMGKGESKQKEILDSRILQSFPNTKYAFDVIWRRGWANLNAGNAAEAVRLWRMADAPNTSAFRRPRVLYWLAHAQKLAGRANEAEKTLNILKKRYPLSIYGLLALNNKIKIIDGDNPAMSIKPSELETWGFIEHARLKLSRPKATAKELYRALKLSRWLGLDESYSEARRLEALLTSGTTLYRNDLEALYPRPFRPQVENAAKTYGVEDKFVWSIMRQESAFRPDAKSYVGASGLMQLMPATAREEAKRAGLSSYEIMNVNDNIKIGTSHLNTLAKTFARKEWIMAAYNAGGGNARKWLRDGGDRLPLDRWIEAIKFEETCGYVQRVSANLEIYRMLYDKQDNKNNK